MRTFVRCTVALFAAAAVSSISSFADSSGRTSIGQHPEVAAAIRVLDSWIATSVADREQPGLSIGIVYDQSLIWSKGYGYADVTRKMPATSHAIPHRVYLEAVHRDRDFAASRCREAAARRPCLEASCLVPTRQRASRESGDLDTSLAHSHLRAAARIPGQLLERSELSDSRGNDSNAGRAEDSVSTRHRVEVLEPCVRDRG